MLEEAKDRLTKVEENQIGLDECSKELKAKSVETYELTAKIEEMKTVIKEKDERALELGKRLNDVRKQFNQAKDEAVEDVFKASDKQLEDTKKETNNEKT